MVQHVALTEPNLHESKGVATATSNTVYVANGAGSGSWKKIDSEVLKSLTGDAASDNKRVVTDGTNGFRLVTDTAYGSMSVNNNTNAFAMVAAADATLATDAQYVLFTGTGAPWGAGSLLYGTTFSTNSLTVVAAGIYALEFWATVVGFPTTTAKIGVKYKLGTGVFSPRRAIIKSTAVGDEDTVGMSNLISLSAGGSVQIYLASTATGNLTVQDAYASLRLVRAL